MGKLLTLLGIDDKKQSGLSEEVFTSEELLLALNIGYQNETDENKKDAIADLIAELSKVVIAEGHKTN